MDEEEQPKEKHFIEKVIELCKQSCKQYGFYISHEDGHGRFIIENFSEEDVKWLRDAIIETKE